MSLACGVIARKIKFKNIHVNDRIAYGPFNNGRIHHLLAHKFEVRLLCIRIISEHKCVFFYFLVNENVFYNYHMCNKSNTAACFTRSYRVMQVKICMKSSY